MQKTVSEVLKTWYFYHSGFWSAGQRGGYCPPRPPRYATVFTPGVMSIHNVSRLLQFLLSGFTFVSLVYEYWKCIILPLQENVNFSNGPANC